MSGSIFCLLRVKEYRFRPTSVYRLCRNLILVTGFLFCGVSSFTLRADSLTLISFENELAKFTVQKTTTVTLHKNANKLFDIDTSEIFPLFIDIEVPVSSTLFTNSSIPQHLRNYSHLKQPDSFTEFLTNIPYFKEDFATTQTNLLEILKSSSSSSKVYVYTIREHDDTRVQTAITKLFKSETSIKPANVISLFNPRLDAPTLNSEADFFDTMQRTYEMVKVFIQDLARIQLNNKDRVVASTQTKGSKELSYENKHIINIVTSSPEFMEEMRSRLVPIVQSGLYPIKFTFLKLVKGTGKDLLFVMEENGLIRAAILQEYEELGLEAPPDCKNMFKN